MVFSSPVFLYIFFPFVWLIHALVPKKLKNSFLLLMSIAFYAYGEGYFVSLMLSTILVTHFSAVIIQINRKFAYAASVFAIVLNLGILGVFKYANFVISQLNYILINFNFTLPDTNFHLPVGISFFTFQAVSCIIDLYRNKKSEKPELIETALYISFFPQLIAGPILRYNNFIPQLKNRMVHYKSFLYGLKRFVYGLSKKILIANTLAVSVDKIFLLDGQSLSTPLALAGSFLFTLQIYFDFSGYSDMALGLARMFGIKIPENFNYPFISKSITEFWRRWHISLSSWLKDYLYISLGGNRKGTARTYLNLSIVFFVCGLWHGASWNFIAFGLLHGVTIIVEKAFSSLKLFSIPVFIKILMTFCIVILFFVVFRTPSFPVAANYLKTMFVWKSSGQSFFSIINMSVISAFFAGVVFAFPVYGIIKKNALKILNQYLLESFEFMIVLLLFAFSISHDSMIFADPFIYFRF